MKKGVECQAKKTTRHEGRFWAGREINGTAVLYFLKGLKVLMSEIEFALSSSGLMWNEDSSTSPEQDEDTTLILQFFLLNCEVVLEPTYPSFYNPPSSLRTI